MNQLLIRCVVDSDSGKTIVNYVFDINDYSQRRVFAEQMTNAYLAGQVVTTFSEQWKPSTAARLKAFVARAWFREHDQEETK